MPLQTYKNYTVDYRLQQFRTIDNDGMIDFVDFKSERGDQIICDMLQDKVFDINKYNL